MTVRAIAKTKILSIEENELYMLALRHPDVIGRLSDLHTDAKDAGGAAGDPPAS